MSYDSKIAQVKVLVDTHNSNVDDSSKVDFDKFMEDLRRQGGTSDDSLRSASWEDLQEAGLPKIMARAASKIFRQENDGGDSKSGWVSAQKAHMMTVKELLERYVPSDPNNTVYGRLEQITKGFPCIVFSKDGEVVLDVSENLIEDIKKGLPPIQTTLVDGLPTPVYKVGERPDQYFDENPIYPGRILRTGQTCDQTNRSWEGVPSIVRQILWLAISQTCELIISGIPDAHDIIDKVVGQKWDEKTIRQRFVKASQLYDSLEKKGQIPTLKVSMNSSLSPQKNQNAPFGKNRSF